MFNNILQKNDNAATCEIAMHESSENQYFGLIKRLTMTLWQILGPEVRSNVSRRNISGKGFKIFPRNDMLQFIRLLCKLPYIVCTPNLFDKNLTRTNTGDRRGVQSSAYHNIGKMLQNLFLKIYNAIFSDITM